MPGQEFVLNWRLGARTATLLAEIAARFDATIEASHGGRAADAKSIFALLALGSEVDEQGRLIPPERDAELGLTAGATIQLTADGPDAAAAVEELGGVLSSGPRVDRCQHPGCTSLPVLAHLTEESITYGCFNGHAWEVSREASQ
ncbi:HPr family phosphocarrier protein [Planctomycetota bacterium]